MYYSIFMNIYFICKLDKVGPVNRMENHTKDMEISSISSTEIPRWRSESLHTWQPGTVSSGSALPLSNYVSGRTGNCSCV